jgi:hypothetical protein
MKGLIIHAALFVVGAASAFSIWSRDEAAQGSKDEQTFEVWAGSPDSLSRLSFEAKNRKVILDRKEDALGGYYVGVVDKEDAPRTDPHASPHAPPKPEPATPGKKSTVRFVSVKSSKELAEKLAPLKALRKIGKIENNRAAEFGFDEPQGTLKLKLAGKDHTLVIGGATPGSREHYAKEQETGLVYAITSDITQMLLAAESRLVERELHGFEETEVARVKISRGGKSREIVTMEDKKDGWADAASPTKVDETARNWMTKVSRLRVMEYVEKPEPAPRPENLVVRLDYFDKKKSLGFLELYSLPGEKKNYVARSEYGRWYVTILASAGEQVDQDVASVLK